MKLRVVDYQYSQDGLAILDEQGKHKKNGGSFLCRAKGDPHPRFYYPGETFELDDEQAKKELRVAGYNQGGRLAIIEPLSDHLQREEKAQAKRNADEKDRDSYIRKLKELEAQTLQSKKLEAMRQENARERAGVPAAEAPTLPKELLDRLDRLEKKTSEQEGHLSLAEAQRAETERKMAELEAQLAAERVRREEAEKALAAKPIESSGRGRGR